MVNKTDNGDGTTIISTFIPTSQTITITNIADDQSPTLPTRDQISITTDIDTLAIASVFLIIILYSISHNQTKIFNTTFNSNVNVFKIDKYASYNATETEFDINNCFDLNLVQLL